MHVDKRRAASELSAIVYFMFRGVSFQDPTYNMSMASLSEHSDAIKLDINICNLFFSSLVWSASQEPVNLHTISKNLVYSLLIFVYL